MLANTPDNLTFKAELKDLGANDDFHQPPKSLQNFQQQFGSYLRGQTHTNSSEAINLQIPKRIGTLYQELIFNNIKGFVNQCFPVCQTVVSTQTWEKLSLEFFQYGQLSSPYFSEINKHFIEFLYQKVDQLANQETSILDYLDLPPYLPDLAHYEWLELALEVEPNVKAQLLYKENNISYRLNPHIRNAHYAWAVQNISADSNEQTPTDSFLVIYRTPSHDVRFMEVNALTHIFINFLINFENQENKIYKNKTELLTAFLHSIGSAIDNNLLAFGQQLLTDLHKKKIIL